VPDPENWLLSTRLRSLHARLLPGASADDAEALWREAETSVAAAGAEEDASVALPVLERSVEDLGALVAGWDSRRTPLPAWDQAVLKRALNAYKKRLKLTRADDEVSSSRSPLTRGASSGIVGVRPPEQYSADVWAVLVAQGRLRDAGHGLLEPASQATLE
jgi:hypothetical protein